MAAQPTGAPREVENAVQETLLIVFVHGFKGTEQTFGNFPDRLQRILAETNLKAEYKVFPSYDTKGDLGKAVVRFADWLTNFTVEKEVASGGGAGKAKIVLCGHSMGGLLIADTLLEILNAQGNKDIPLWPNIVACIAFDTPFFGYTPSCYQEQCYQSYRIRVYCTDSRLNHFWSSCWRRNRELCRTSSGAKYAIGEHHRMGEMGSTCSICCWKCSFGWCDCMGSIQ